MKLLQTSGHVNIIGKWKILWTFLNDFFGLFSQKCSDSKLSFLGGFALVPCTVYLVVSLKAVSNPFEFLREALFTSVGKSKPDVPSVRPSVRPFVRSFGK